MFHVRAFESKMAFHKAQVLEPINVFIQTDDIICMKADLSGSVLLGTRSH